MTDKTEPARDEAAEITAAREALGLSQAQLARVLGCARGTISRIEGRTLKPNTQIQRLVAAYQSGYRPPDWPTKP